MMRPEPSHDGPARLAAAARLARAGGRIALEHWTRAQISWKPDDTMVTDADLAIQSCLDREIAAEFPEDGLLGEENGGSTPRGLEATYVWIVDPIDGTDNFGRGCRASRSRSGCSNMDGRSAARSTIP